MTPKEKAEELIHHYIKELLSANLLLGAIKTYDYERYS